ncbi:MAG: hypothetical protein IKI31_00205, partial [Treponema sp.]|nr:hypothetical protein [Treponema sp.]
ATNMPMIFACAPLYCMYGSAYFLSCKAIFFSKNVMSVKSYELLQKNSLFFRKKFQKIHILCELYSEEKIKIL